MLARIYVATEGRIPLIGIGGIDSAARALEKIAAGASLLQLYTGLVYEGFGLLDRLKQGLVAELDRRGGALDEIVGTQADAWAAKVV